MRAFLLSFHALLLMAACGSLDGSGTNQGTDASTDSATCSGLPPDNCDGCCGQTYAADLCVNGAWTCRIAGGACSPCDGGHDATASDATTCTGTAPVICNGCCGNKYAADQCTNGVWSCL
ncbi:MAG: hypothetical protein M3O46_15915, partial [Myxococcota bacterium]|nr:hypothetical protein [Myxococcota bacterium]